VVLQTAYLTPPMAPSIFYLRSIWPFIVLRALVTSLVILFPQTVLWLPQALR
jgi:TRAP-type mannitol/chloroaromatic compound transport system permease large subunit